MHLKQDARLEQDGGIVTGSQIDYDVKGERMVASGRAGVACRIDQSGPNTLAAAQNGITHGLVQMSRRY